MWAGSGMSERRLSSPENRDVSKPSIETLFRLSMVINHNVKDSFALILWFYAWFTVPDHCSHLIVCQDTISPHALEHTSFAPFLKALADGAWRSQTARERVPFAAGAEGV